MNAPNPITADDPRHGTPRGYYAGCRKPCCMAARCRDEKRRIYERHNGRSRRRESTGTQRRIQALMVIGWTSTHIADLGNWNNPESVQNMLKCGFVYSYNHDKICEIYDQLSMTPGPSTQGRNRALAKGWFPPLAWDEETIDDWAAEPNVVSDEDVIDEVLIQRALNGIRVKANPAERAEIERRWVAAGRPLNELARTQGTNIWRDRRTA